MSRWTEDNTEGFTAAELDMINRVRNDVINAMIESDPDFEWTEHEGAIDDMITNAYVPGITGPALFAEITRRMSFAGAA